MKFLLFKDEFESEWSRLEKDGILTENLAKNVWKEFSEPTDVLLEMMEKFDLICEDTRRETGDTVN